MRMHKCIVSSRMSGAAAFKGFAGSVQPNQNF